MGMALRDIYGESLVKYAGLNDRVVVLDADLSNSSKTCMMAAAYPERVFDVGIAEGNMAAMGAGFARSGFIPFVNTFATLASSMCALSAKALIGYSGLNVRIVGSNNGLGGGYDGATHHAIEDINVMRGIPGMLVMSPSDGIMLDWMVKMLVEDYKGPVYVSIPRNGYENIYDTGENFKIGKAKQLSEGKDAAIFAAGLSVYRAGKAVEILAAQGIRASLFDMFTIKPLDRETVIRAAGETGAVVIVEEHSIIGGLGTAVLEVLAEEKIQAEISRLGIRDCYTESGSYEELVEIFGLGTNSIVNEVRSVVSRKEDMGCGRR